jgi:hypothetical protein
MRSLLVAVPCLVVAACADHRAGRVGDIDPAISNVVFRARGALPLSVQSSVDVAIGDFDQDGDTDLAALDLTGRLVVRLRTGEDSYADAQALPVQGKPLAILASNLDSDYDLDLVVVSAEANVATVFVNDGAASFTQVQVIGVQELPTGAAIGDYTGDGIDDLVVTHLSRSDVLVFDGQGDATFGAPTSVPIPRGTRTAGLTIADVNQDSFQDIAICDTDNDRVIIRFGSPSEIGGGVAIVEVGRTPVAMSVGDVNEDLRIDLAISCFDSLQVDFITDQGKGGFGVFRSLSVEGKPANSTIADLDGDGFDEFAVCLLNKSAVSIFAGTDEGLADAEYQLPATGFPYRPIIADIIGDGRADLGLVSTEIAAMNVYRGTAEFLHCERTVAPEGAWQPHMVAAADFDGDGEIDIATAGASSNLVSFLSPSRQPTGPVLAEPASVDLGQGFSNLVVADVDGDARGDLLVALVDGVKLLANESSAGSFDFAPVPAAASAMLAPGTVAAGIAYGDVTGDGLGDVVVSHSSARTASRSCPVRRVASSSRRPSGPRSRVARSVSSSATSTRTLRPRSRSRSPWRAASTSSTSPPTARSARPRASPSAKVRPTCGRPTSTATAAPTSRSAAPSTTRSGSSSRKRAPASGRWRSRPPRVRPPS